LPADRAAGFPRRWRFPHPESSGTPRITAASGRTPPSQGIRACTRRSAPVPRPI
jgi:hypothetical protein